MIETSKSRTDAPVQPYLFTPSRDALVPATVLLGSYIVLDQHHSLFSMLPVCFNFPFLSLQPLNLQMSLLGLLEILGTAVSCFFGFPVLFLQQNKTKQNTHIHNYFTCVFCLVGLFSSGATRGFTCILT